MDGGLVVGVVGPSGQLVEKAAGNGRPRFAPLEAIQRQRERQAALRAGDADVAEAAFFIDRRARLGDAAVVRQRALFHADHVDLAEFQALGGVKRHQGDGVAFELRFLVLVVFVAGQGDLLQEAGGGGAMAVVRLPAGSRRPPR